MNAPASTSEANSSLPPTFNVVPLLHLHPHEIEFYWQTHYVQGTLQDRWVDIKEPTWEDIKDVISRQGSKMFAVVDASTGQMTAEFMMATMIGASVQLHFSIHHECSGKDKIKIIQTATEHILKHSHFVSIFGLTPFKHAARILVFAGYKNRGILKGAIKAHDGTFMDAYMVVAQ